MPIDQLLEGQFFPIQTRIRNEKTRRHYRRAVRFLGEMLERPPRVTDLSDDNVAALLHWLTTTRKQTAVTANTSRKCLVSLWRWCHNRGLTTTGPTIQPLPTPRRQPRAWRREEMARLLEAARDTPGSICGMPARVWWLVLFALEWDTGARAGELFAFRWEWLDFESGWLTCPAEYRKGNVSDAVYGLLPDTLGLLRNIAKPSGLILQWPTDRNVSRYYQLWSDLLERAGLPNDRRHKTQCLRRTFASFLAAGGGDPTAACGHADRSTTQRYYLDPVVTATKHGVNMPFRLLGEAS